MRKYNKAILAVMGVAFSIFLTACSGNEKVNAISVAATKPEIKAKSGADDNMENKEILINIGGKQFEAVLENNETAKSFLNYVPLGLFMEELNGNEKYFLFDEKLRRDKPKRFDTIHAGDLMCYGDGYIVLFYKTHKTSYEYVPVGRIKTADGLADAVGRGNVQVSFSLKDSNK